MSGQGAPWMLYLAGAVLALILNFMGVPVLPFALGMFIPLHLNLPLLVGGGIAWLVGEKHQEKGTLIASGFIAGGALMGVVSAIVKFCGADWYLTGWAESGWAAIVGIVAYVALIAYFVVATKRK